MNLFLVSDETGRERWVAYEDDIAEQLYVFVANTGTFHRNDPVGVDYYYDQRLTYEPIDVATATSKIKAGLGRIDERTTGWLVDRYRADPDARPVASVLGEPAQLRVITPKARAARFAKTLTAAKKGVWVTYKAYPAESRQLAHVAAHDLRKGKVRALASAGPIEVRVADAPDGRVAVQVARGGPDTPARAYSARKTAPRAVNAPIRRDPTPAIAPDRPETWPKALQRILELLHKDGGWTSGGGRPTGADVEQFEDLTGLLLQCERVRGEPAFWSLLHGDGRDQPKAEQLWHSLHEPSTQ